MCAVKVLIIDDSALIRALLTEIFESDSRFKVVAAAEDAYQARDLIKKHNPDVLTLDIEMPKMNGIMFLQNLMRLRPMPVVMISTLTQQGAPVTLEALEHGAVDFVPKPKSDGSGGLESCRQTILEKVWHASRANVRPKATKREKEKLVEEAKRNNSLIGRKCLRTDFLCAIGASTGGTEAIKEVITCLPENSPAIVIAQHIPGTFSASFARRVDNASKINVYQAEDGQPIKSGCAYIAPGDAHLKVVLAAGSYICKLDNSGPVNRHMPSVEVLYDSVLEASGGRNTMGVLLTGMGADGSEALLRMKQANCMTIAQDEASSVVWGMPGHAVKIGGAEKILPLNRVASEILSVAFR